MSTAASACNDGQNHRTGSRSPLLCLIICCLLPLPSLALEFQCELNGDVRYLRVDIPGTEHLCEVNVTYENTGEQKRMWYADNDSLFCSAKAYELSDKYKNTWGFSCIQWPDHDGIDRLSPSQRTILDTQLKQLMNEGEAAEEPFTVIATKATASTLLDQDPGIVALQYFLSDGTDRTQLVNDAETGWEVFATIEELATHISGPDTIDSALITSVTDGGALEVLTTVATSNPGELCHGKQVLMARDNNTLTARTAHKVICSSSEMASAPGD